MNDTRLTKKENDAYFCVMNLCSYKRKQAHKAHSSAFCIDLQRQTLMAMMGNDDNDGQWWQWWAMMGNEDNDVIPLRNLPQSQCFALALYCNEEVKNI